MKITASVRNAAHSHRITLATDGRESTITIAPRENGFGSSANGGELLCLALATCFCNDVYREAAKQGITVRGVEVDVTSRFGGVGEAAREISYRARIDGDASSEALRALAAHTDRVAEIQNTLRAGIAVRFEERVESRESRVES